MLVLTGKSQETPTPSLANSKYSVKTGAGYFYCPPAGSHGTAFWVEGSRRLSTGFNLSLMLQHSQSYMELKDEMWGTLVGQKKPDVFYIADLSFSRPIRLSGSQTLELGLGLLYEKSYTWLPAVEFINGTPYLQNSFFRKLEDIGFSAKADYSYRFANGLSVGCRVYLTYVTSMVEGISVTPILGFRF